MDTFQVLIAIAIFITVSFFVFLSVQIFFVLKELREVLRKTNLIMDSAVEVSEHVGSSVKKIGSFLNVMEFIKNRFNK